jgi:hypothetical protein
MFDLKPSGKHKLRWGELLHAGKLMSAPGFVNGFEQPTEEHKPLFG